MKFGVNTFLWSAAFGPEQFDLLPVIREQGFDGVEIPLIHLAGFPAAAIRRELERNDLACTVCSVLPRNLSLVSEDPDVRRLTRSHLSDCFKVCADLGSAYIAGPLYAPVGYLPGRRRTPDEWNWALEAYQEVAPLLSSYRIHLCLEPLNRFETYFLNTTADAVRLCAEIGHPQIGILWDTFHANIEEKSLPDALRSCGKYLKHVHTSENDRGTPGTGHIDWRGVVSVLRELRYDGWLTIESFGFALGELSAAASIWRDLAGSPGEICCEGVKFLKAALSEAN
ncbi:MAG: sugar phosphate isomerase/epimerase [Acidobacteriaceae bacterium]|nr:sugar phosphate isomerase/epimerase [Acidobacteriaceae bacterium]MBV9500541.1 sugar phosphate isomerase/epimerase [Acidobacteriaceae bacterium]